MDCNKPKQNLLIAHGLLNKYNSNQELYRLDTIKTKL